MRAEELSICLLYMRRRALGRDWYEHKCEHGCARVVYSLEPISLIFSTGAVKAAPTAPPNKTPQIRQTTDDDGDFVGGIMGRAIVLGMVLMIYACHSCYIRFCRNRQDNESAILNLPNMMQVTVPVSHWFSVSSQKWWYYLSKPRPNHIIFSRNAIKKGESLFCGYGLAGPPMSSNVRGVFSCLFVCFSVCFSVLLNRISFTDD